MTIDIDAIEAQVAELQRKNSPSEVRTTLFNLVAVLDEGDQQAVDRTISSLLGRRAARIIQIIDTDDTESSVAVSARCMRAENNQSVCFQEILLRDGADRAGAAPGSWTPLIIRDLPIYIWWARPLTDDSEASGLFSFALDLADKFLFDSSLGPDAPAELEAVRRHVLPADTVVADFAWRRIASLQRLVARAFDSYGRERLPELFADLGGVSVTGLRPAEAQLFFGWLAGRLGRRPLPGGFSSPAGREVSVRHEPSTGSGEGITAEFEFRSGDHGPLVLAAHPDGCADIEGAALPRRREVFRFLDDGELLLREVDSAGPDFLYREALDHLTLA